MEPQERLYILAPRVKNLGRCEEDHVLEFWCSLLETNSLLPCLGGAGLASSRIDINVHASTDQGKPLVASSTYPVSSALAYRMADAVILEDKELGIVSPPRVREILSMRPVSAETEAWLTSVLVEDFVQVSKQLEWFQKSEGNHASLTIVTVSASLETWEMFALCDPVSVQSRWFAAEVREMLEEGSM